MRWATVVPEIRENKKKAVSIRGWLAGWLLRLERERERTKQQNRRKELPFSCIIYTHLL